jgi:hypothetical protein
MFDTGNTSFQNYLLQACCSQGVDTRRYGIALNYFKSGLFQGKVSRFMKLLLGHQQWLYDLNEYRTYLSSGGSSHAGIRIVPIRQIIGSEGRGADFDGSFHPVNVNSRERWVNMAILFMSRVPLPLVKLIQIGDAYFVRDGHHRISVACALGQVAVDAEVITWQAQPPFPWQSSSVRNPSLSY